MYFGDNPGRTREGSGESEGGRSGGLSPGRPWSASLTAIAVAWAGPASALGEHFCILRRAWGPTGLLDLRPAGPSEVN